MRHASSEKSLPSCFLKSIKCPASSCARAPSSPRACGSAPHRVGAASPDVVYMHVCMYVYICVYGRYQAGKPSALVVDCGAGLTSVTPVNDGYALKNCACAVCTCLAAVMHPHSLRSPPPHTHTYIYVHSHTRARIRLVPAGVCGPCGDRPHASVPGAGDEGQGASALSRAGTQRHAGALAWGQRD
jgi:hypothetical protein